MRELFANEAPFSFCSPSGVVEQATSAALEPMRRLELIVNLLLNAGACFSVYLPHSEEGPQ